VDDCSICMKCIVDAPPAPPVHPGKLNKEDFMPMDVNEKQTKPVCSECRGCSTQLQLLVGARQLGESRRAHVPHGEGRQG
jgi:hypothetical protein